VRGPACATLRDSADPEADRGKGILEVTAAILAYIDPGSGSVLLQALLGGVAALGVTMKLYWKRIRRLLRGRGNQEE
jgi:hypothetical protein